MAGNVRRAAVFLAVCLAAQAASAIQGGLLPNGNFELAPPKSQLNGSRVMGRYAIPHWEISGYVEYICSGQKQGDMLLPVPEGAYAVRLGNEASILQRIPLTRGAHYSVTFSAARTCAQAEQLNVTVAPESDILPIQTVYTSSGWDSYSWAFRATSSVVSFIVHNPGVSEDPACGPLIDQFAIKTLPPPQSTKNNLLKNGDFEEGPYIFRNTPWGVLLPPMDEDDYSPLSPWMVLSSTKSVKLVDAPHFVVPHGGRAVELVSGMETALVQDVRTAPGSTYKLEFSAGDAGDGCVGAMTVQAYAGHGSVRVPYQSQGKGGYKRAALEFTAVTNETRVVFVSMAYNLKPDGTLCGPVVDDVSLVCTRKHVVRSMGRIHSLVDANGCRQTQEARASRAIPSHHPSGEPTTAPHRTSGRRMMPWRPGHHLDPARVPLSRLETHRACNLDMIYPASPRETDASRAHRGSVRVHIQPEKKTMARHGRLAALFLLTCFVSARAATAILDGKSSHRTRYVTLVHANESSEVASMLCTLCSSPGLLPNGNFEEAPARSELNGTRVTGRFAIPHWEVSGFVEFIGPGQKQGDMILPVPEGAYAVRLGNEASIQQRLANLARRTYYSITFSAARTCAQAEQLNVTVAPESDVLPIQTVYTSSGWDSYSWAFKARCSAVTLIVHNPGVTDDPACGPLLDSFAIKTLQPPQRPKNNMLKNGDFEEGPYIFPDAPWGVLVPPLDEDDYSPLSPWMILSSTKSVKYVDAAHGYAVPHGTRAVELVSGMETALAQDVRTVPGRGYRLEFSAGDAGDGCVGSLAVQAYAARGSVRVPYESQGKGGYQRGVLDFTAIANQTRVVFVSMAYTMKGDGTLCGPVIDDASLVGLPGRGARRPLPTPPLPSSSTRRPHAGSPIDLSVLGPAHTTGLGVTAARLPGRTGAECSCYSRDPKKLPRRAILQPQPQPVGHIIPRHTLTHGDLITPEGLPALLSARTAPLLVLRDSRGPAISGATRRHWSATLFRHRSITGRELRRAHEKAKEPGMAENTSARCLLLLVLVGAAARVASGINDGPLPNGNFEQGPDPSQLNGTRVMGQHAIPNWEISGFVEYIQSGQNQDGMVLAVPEGAHAVRLGNDASIRQQLTILARRTYYSITFSAARTCAQAEQLNVSVAPESGVLPIQTVYTSSGWDSYSYAFRARHTTAWLTVHNPGLEEDPACGPLIDAFDIKTLDPPHREKGNLLKNGDFEDGPYIPPDSPWGMLVPPQDEDDVSPLPGWMIMSDTKSIKYVDAAHHAVPHGSYAVELVAGSECALLQEARTVSGRAYRLSFSVGDTGKECIQQLAVKAAAGYSSVVVTYDSQGTGGSKRAELDFTAMDNVTRVVFQSMNHYMKPDGTLCGPVIDDVSLVTVRKPAARRLFM
ncbi:hypothetical protein HU200_031762 [Digitaria exilis]|uniref:DUF642 domain-containing protein n=1 Tax=Digitaria exilis TaxID=1010633 RepID=A0A835BPP5_9POAL|nr:hypothetical protein HU200_031762 [Digitaria exilis]